MKAIITLTLILLLFTLARAVECTTIPCCGDGTCEFHYYPSENCDSCPQDCGCNSLEACVPDVASYDYGAWSTNRWIDRGCAPKISCGDGACEVGYDVRRHAQGLANESCLTCGSDCGCVTEYNPYGECRPTNENANGRGCVQVSYCGDNLCDTLALTDNRIDRAFSTNDGSDITLPEYCHDCPEDCNTCPQDCGCDLIESWNTDFTYECNASKKSSTSSWGCFYVPECGNGRCDYGSSIDSDKQEDCHSCPDDCACEDGFECDDTTYGYSCINATEAGTKWQACDETSGKLCRITCGDGYCEPPRGETCETCGSDCACSTGYVCNPASPHQYSNGCVSKADNDAEQTTVPVVEETITSEMCSNARDDDKDGKTDCLDPDCYNHKTCVSEMKTKLAEGIKNKYIDDLNRMNMAEHADTINTYYDLYKDNPDKLIIEMSKYMDSTVYKTKKVNAYLNVFSYDPSKQADIQNIINNNQNDLKERDTQLETYVLTNSKKYSDFTKLNAYLTDAVLNPPKWLIGGEANSGGVTDWTNLVSQNVANQGNALGVSPTSKVNVIATGTTVIMVAYDMKSLYDNANELKKQGLDENKQTGIIILDGALKLGKIVDPTGYLANMGDATVGGVIKLNKQLTDNAQGNVLWNGHVLHQEGNGYKDIETNEIYNKVSGGMFSTTTFVKK